MRLLRSVRGSDLWPAFSQTLKEGQGNYGGGGVSEALHSDSKFERTPKTSVTNIDDTLLPYLKNKNQC